jgi:hypothetical protein
MDSNQTPIQVHTQYTYTEMKTFQKFFFRKSKYVAWVIAPVSLIAFIYLRFGGEDAEGFDYLQYLIIPAILLLISSGVFYTKKTYAKQAKLFKNGHTYTFMDNHFVIDHDNRDFGGTGKVAYEIINRAWETRDMLYLFLDNRQAYLVSKNGFQSGTIEELRTLLQRNMPQGKYKIKR